MKKKCWRESKGGMFTLPIQDDRMNMTEICEHDQKIHNDEQLLKRAPPVVFELLPKSFWH